jgi:predicted nucleotidyltransferase
LADQEKLVECLRQTILNLTNPSQILLFGSAARREMTTASDLDVVVIVETPNEVKVTQKALNHLSRLLDWPVDCLVVHREMFDQRAAIGGVFAVAQDEGVTLAVSRSEDAGPRGP